MSKRRATGERVGPDKDVKLRAKVKRLGHLMDETQNIPGAANRTQERLFATRVMREFRGRENELDALIDELEAYRRERKSEVLP